MSIRATIFVLLVCLISGTCLALEPAEILIIANSNSPASLRIAEYYCQKRGASQENILKLPLGRTLTDQISRSDYDSLIAGPLRSKLSIALFAGRIKCLLTVYGVPFKVGKRGMLKGEQQNLAKLNEMVRYKTDQLRKNLGQLEVLTGVKCATLTGADKQPSVKTILKKLDFYVQDTYTKIQGMRDESQKQQLLWKWLNLYKDIYGAIKTLRTAKTGFNPPLRLSASERIEIEECMRIVKQAKNDNWDFSRRIKDGFYASLEKTAGLNGLLLRLNDDIDSIKGADTGASVDSELSMVMFDDYPLYRQQPNELKDRLFWVGVKTLMVSRLDGPGEDIAIGLIDKAMAAEKTGLKGVAYIDSGYSQAKLSGSLYAEYDQSLLNTASMLQMRSDMKVVQEQTPQLFTSGRCPQTAVYCGWYSLKKYVDAFDFVDGAVGYHIASFEAADLRNGQSSQWCPAMLKDGITATIGAVNEPYLAAFPKPRHFFSELVRGKTLAEAFYKSKPFNSWQMVLIGDPLYKPFGRSGSSSNKKYQP